MDDRNREQMIRQHLDAIRALEASAASGGGARTWPPEGYYLLWHVVIGMMLGTIGAAVSLLANVVGAPLFGKPALELIRVYLTFPMGERALAADTGLVLTVGCLLYLVTGALYGIAFHLVLSTLFARSSAGRRLAVATLVGLALWVTNFYLVLSWLQPLLLGGRWIVDLVPWWVAALTHLAFAWTVLALEPLWGRFVAYGPPAAAAAAAVLILGSGAAAGAQQPAPAPAPGDPKPVAYPKWETVEPGGYHGYNRRASLVQRGREVYRTYCAGCHGDGGDGNGPAAARLETKPRDFTRGVFKFRSTDSSSLPLDTDLYRTITRGLARVSMPGFPLLPETDKVAVIAYVKQFYPRWDREAKDRVAVPVPRAPADLDAPARRQRGRVVYVTMQCGSCHGNDGRGGDTVFTDLWGHPQKAFDFTRGRLKSGNDPEDIYRTFHTGLVSIMPAFGGTLLANVTADAFSKQEHRLAAGEKEALAPVVARFPATIAEIDAMSLAEQTELAERNSWDLVAYVRSLRVPTTTAPAVLGEVRQP